jgi:hypothetical protein
MTLDNSPVVVRDRKLMYIMAISLILLITMFSFIDAFDRPVLHITRECYIIGVSALYLLINLYRFIIDLNYFSYEDQGEKIIIRYFSLRPFNQKRKSLEIPRGSFLKYEIRKSFMGQKKSLIMFQKIKNKVAKYPPISITALNKEELKSLHISLNALLQK